MIKNFSEYTKNEKGIGGGENPSSIPSSLHRYEMEDGEVFDLVNTNGFSFYLSRQYLTDFFKSVNWIDMGGSILWADRNLGASDVKDIGIMMNEPDMENINLPKDVYIPGSSEILELKDLDIDYDESSIILQDKLSIPKSGYLYKGNVYDRKKSYFWADKRRFDKDGRMMYYLYGNHENINLTNIIYDEIRKFPIRLVKQK